VKIAPFGVEIWMNANETKCRYNIAESCVDSITFADLMALAGTSHDILAELNAMKLTYGAIEGSDRLRRAIAALYKDRAPETVLVTHGAAGANALLYETLVEPGDELVALTPTYQQHISIPESLGGNVRQLHLRPERGYLPDLAELATKVTARTRIISLTNPNNPTGAGLDDELLRNIADIAARQDAWVICDEVYRGVDQSTDVLSTSIADIYPKGVSVGSMSKAFALAGLRLGWIVAPPALLREVSIHRDYTTISVGMIDDRIATIALENRDALLARNRRIVRSNLGILSRWVAGEPLIDWVKPTGATVTLLSYGLDVPSEVFCRRLLDETGVLLVPGSAFGMDGSVRIGFGNGVEALVPGLEALSQFLRTYSH
jgi:aspartate/methionine/tyrosine aminotransferase